MRRIRLLALVLAGVSLPAALLLWAVREAEGERRELEQALRTEAALLAQTLGPALAAASAAARELDELLARKLLDDARLLARLEAAGALPPGAAADLLLESDGLDGLLRLAPDGAVRWQAGRPGDAARLRRDLAPLLGGAAEELVLGSARGARDPVAAAVRTPDGGALAAVADPRRAFAFGAQLGVGNLLRRLVANDAVLYLMYEERPHGLRASAAWDGGAAPAPGTPPPAVLRGRPVFEVAVPVASPAGRAAALRVGLDGGPLRRAVSSGARRTALLGALLAALGVVAAAFALAQRARAREREEGRLRLAAAEESRRRSERLAAAGALAAGIAHEVRNPLNGIALAAQRIARLDGDGRAARLATRIREEVARLEAALEGFLDLARPAAGPRRATDLGDLVRDTLALLELEASGKGVQLAARTEAAPVVGDAEALRRAVINLVRNAIAASPEGGAIEVSVAAAAGGRGPARVVVRDHGAGIAPDLVERAFDPFVTTRPEGTGLGLALVRRVAEEHGGAARLRNHPAGGVEASLEIPAGEAAA
jgi:signal transduction histidine kinase